LKPLGNTAGRLVGVGHPGVGDPWYGELAHFSRGILVIERLPDGVNSQHDYPRSWMYQATR